MLSDNPSTAPKILVIDDEPAIRTFTAVLLEDLGYSAAMAEHGRAGVQFLLQDPGAVAAVLLDMTMPGLSPEETCRMLKEISPDLPVIILSGELESTVRERFPAQALAGYIYKPDLDVSLESALTQALNQAPAPTIVSRPVKLSRISDEETDSMRREFLQKCRHQFPGIRQSLTQGDFEALRAAGHTLKGSGGCFGLFELTNLGKALEAYAANSDASGCGRQLALIDRYLETA